ncbi:hypothetical protein NDU88_002574 [Pleurodeles waltl]|uniref:Uncharacterized protein n=1 Tax=Pleurodeles waltl TaxID=8319 RepID=A0AAV7TM61_PLEWA|nr:hypothetical protein NDU88_002574 [Pleurodeles waltl]
MDAAAGDSLQRQIDSNISLTAHTAAILEAIKDTKTSLKTLTVAEAGEVGLLQDEKLADQVKETEDHLETARWQIKGHSESFCYEREMQQLATKIENANGRFCPHNVQLIGIAERA